MSEGTEEAVKAAKKVKSSLELLRDARAELVEAICKAEDAIAALRNAPLSLDDWGTYLRAYIASRGNQFPPKLLASRLLSVSISGSSGLPENKRPWSEFDYTGDGSSINLSDSKLLWDGDAIPVLCALFGDQIHGLIMADLKQRIGAQWGNEKVMPIALRRGLIKELQDQRAVLVERRVRIQTEIDGLMGMFEH